jgi:hypothetical protein
VLSALDQTETVSTIVASVV